MQLLRTSSSCPIQDTTHLLQPLDVALFAPLQSAYGAAVATHTRTTRTGVSKALFWNFYKLAKHEAYTKTNIKSAWRATGIHPFNPDKVLAEIEKKKMRNHSLPLDLHQLLNHLSFSRSLKTGGNFGNRPWLPLVLLKAGRRNLLSSYCEKWHTRLMLLGHGQNWPILRMKTSRSATLARRDRGGAARR